MTRHHGHHHLAHHHHPRHTTHHGGKSGLHKAWDYSATKIVAPVYQDLIRDPIRAIEKLPAQALTTVDHTVSSPGFSITILAAVGVALFLVLK